MAALSTQDRTRIWRGVMRYWSRERETTGAFTKFDLYNPSANTGAIADLDNWLDTHGGNTTPDNVGANGALSSTMRAELTTLQKGLLVAVIALARTGNIDLLRRVVGETE